MSFEVGKKALDFLIANSGSRKNVSLVFRYRMSGRIKSAAPPLIDEGAKTLGASADPLPQALVLTAIVISFATTALLLVVLLASRGLTGTDHVDGEEGDP